MGRIKREPVMVAGIVGAIMSGLAMAVGLGWLRLDQTQMGLVETFLMAMVPIVILVASWIARRYVTPTASPRTKDGQPAQIIPLDSDRQ